MVLIQSPVWMPVGPGDRSDHWLSMKIINSVRSFITHYFVSYGLPFAIDSARTMLDVRRGFKSSKDHGSVFCFFLSACSRSGNSLLKPMVGIIIDE